MKKTFSYTTNGSIMQMELNLAYYVHNRTLAVAFYEQGHGRNEEYWMLTCCLDDAPGKNRAFLDVNNLGEQVVDDLEAAGFGTRTGRSAKSGYVTYPEFEFDAEVLKAYSNREYVQYLKWQDGLKDDEQYLTAECEVCQNRFAFIVKRSAVEKYRLYQEGAPYLIQDIFPDMSPGERGLFARGQNMCDRCFKAIFGME